MRVGITGCSGYVGIALLKYLHNKNFTVININRSNYDNNFDLDVLIHLASPTHNKIRFEDGYFANVEMLSIILQNNNIKQVIYLSSTKVINSNNITVASNVYSACKIMGEFNIELMSHKYNYKYQILRVPLVLGGNRKSKGSLALFTKIFKYSPLIILDNVNNKRLYISLNKLCEYIVGLVANEAVINSKVVIANSDAITTNQILTSSIKHNRIIYSKAAWFIVKLLIPRLYNRIYGSNYVDVDIIL
jgi:nucleoside-diphosphate-sugar epimerase